MQRSEREIESILLRLEEIVEQIYLTLASVKESEGITIGDQIDLLYDEKQRIIDALIHKVQNEISTLAVEEKKNDGNQTCFYIAKRICKFAVNGDVH